MADQSHAASCRAEIEFLRVGINRVGFLAVDVQNELYRVGEIFQACRACFALTVGTRNLKASRPKAAFVRLATMKNCGEVFHGRKNKGTSSG